MRIKVLRRSRHRWLCVPTIPAVVVDCCVFVLLVDSISHLSLSLIQGTVTCSMSAQQHYLSTQLTTVHCIYLPTWWFRLSLGWWVDYPTLQRFRDIYHYILLLVLRPAGDIGGLHRSICPPINAYYITLNLGSWLRSTSIHPAPYTTYCLLILLITCRQSAANKCCRWQILISWSGGGVSKLSQSLSQRCLKDVSKVSQLRHMCLNLSQRCPKCLNEIAKLSPNYRSSSKLLRWCTYIIVALLFYADMTN